MKETPQQSQPGIPALVNKRVSFRFHGENLLFDLSMALFSSHDIDAGSRLLLKTLVQQLPLEKYKRVLDAGCGTGVLGLCLKKKSPPMDLVFQDRDALAVAFTKHNARVNGLVVPEKSFQTGLLLEDTPPDSVDLIISNIPAKAGKPVIESFLGKAAASLTREGRGAFVIVDPLKEMALEYLEKKGIPLVYRESTKMYTVLHIAKAPACPQDKGFTPYIRRAGSFALCKESYKLTTAYGLPDFDKLSYALQVSGEVLRHHAFTGKALFWNPGQGHLPQWLASRPSNHFSSISLASRDSLQCRISALNLEHSGYEGTVQNLPLPGEDWLLPQWGKEAFDGLFMTLNPVPGVKWHAPLARSIKDLVKTGKYSFILARSSDMALLEKHLSGFSKLKDERFKGNRGILLRKNKN